MFSWAPNLNDGKILNLIWKKDSFSGLFCTRVILSIEKILLSKVNEKNKEVKYYLEKSHFS